MVGSDKPGSRAAQRLEAVTNQLVPSAIDSVKKEENAQDKMTDRGSYDTPEVKMPKTRRIVTGKSTASTPNTRYTLHHLHTPHSTRRSILCALLSTL